MHFLAAVNPLAAVPRKSLVRTAKHLLCTCMPSARSSHLPGDHDPYCAAVRDWTQRFGGDGMQTYGRKFQKCALSTLQWEVGSTDNGK